MSARRTLADWLAGRDNNFNLLRLVAATLVIYAHSHPFVQGFIDGREPDWRGDALYALTGLDSGRIAVSVFFIISGFLVSQSLAHRSSLADFYRARALRILPALWVAVLFCAFVIGPVFTSASLHDYLVDGELRHFLGYNLTLRNDPSQHLPGLFAQNPYARVVNGSLWTLPWEALMYLSLGAIALLGIFRRRILVLMLTVVMYCAFCYGREISRFEVASLRQAVAFASFFYLGVLLYLYRDRVPMSRATFLGGLAALALTLALYKHTAIARCLFPPALAYAVLAAAYVWEGRIRAFNRIGDYSYGTYVYAFPIQQAVVSLFPSLTPLELCAASIPATLALAIPSWHLVEKPMLRLKS